jgi:hypothetical protein
MINDALVLTVDVTVEREDRFQLDTGWSPPLCCQACAATPGGCTPQVARHVILKLTQAEVPHTALPGFASPPLLRCPEDVQEAPGKPNAHVFAMLLCTPL